MSDIKSIEQALNEWKELRNKATVLTGFEETNGMFNSNPDSNLVYFLIELFCFYTFALQAISK